MAIDFKRYRGLTAAQVNAHQREQGMNILFEQQKKGLLSYIVEIAQEPMLLLLLAASGLYFLLGNAWDGALMIGGVMVMIGIDKYQEAKTDRALAALKEMSTPKVGVIRNGKQTVIANEQLTVGDILVVQEGERVAGDGILMATSNFMVDESMLTGESGGIYKSEDDERNNLAYAGTLALSGQALVQVTAVGSKTQYGRIGVSLASIHEQATPLQRKTRKLVKYFGIGGLLSCLALIGISYATTGLIIESLLKGLTLAISVIPEELPVVITVFAALGAYRLTRKKALVRKMNAIETLGHLTTLCTDKTGTLTENRVTLDSIGMGETAVSVKGAIKKEDDEMTRAAISDTLMACQRIPYDPMDMSIHEFAHKIGVDPDAIFGKSGLEREYGFDQRLKFMGHVWVADSRRTLYVKGSAEQVVARCGLEPAALAAANAMIENMARQGMRVLAMAKGPIPSGDLPNSLEDTAGLHLVAILGFQDPPKPDAKLAVKACQRAGITVRMITGDHPQTALHIAKAVGIRTKDGVMSGDEVDAYDDVALAEKIADIHVFARINPEQKLKLIAALKRRGEVVGMIGDGVNDAPSLKEADAGIAMGMRGTNVAREAADLILMDDKLGTVVQAIHDGRRIFDNIQKSTAFVFTVHVYVVLLALIVPLAGLPVLLTPILIVLLELLIDPTCALVFEAIPGEPDLMTRKPRDPARPLISSKRFWRIGALGSAIFFMVFFSYLYAIRGGMAPELARTLAFSTLLWSNIFLVLASVSRKKTMLQSIAFIANPTFRNVYLSMLIFLIALIYLPYVNSRFGFRPLDPLLFMLAIVMGFIPFLLSELHKLQTQKITHT